MMADKRLRVGVVFGGRSGEHEVSLAGASSVMAAIDRMRFDVVPIGIAKPDPRVFHLGLQEAGAAAAEAVYVGDSYFVDVLGAREVGMDAVLFDPGRLWGPRDCRVAGGLGAAVSHALGAARSDR